MVATGLFLRAMLCRLGHQVFPDLETWVSNLRVVAWKPEEITLILPVGTYESQLFSLLTGGRTRIGFPWLSILKGVRGSLLLLRSCWKLDFLLDLTRGVRVLLLYPCWEQRFLSLFMALSFLFLLLAALFSSPDRVSPVSSSSESHSSLSYFLQDFTEIPDSIPLVACISGTDRRVNARSVQQFGIGGYTSTIITRVIRTVVPAEEMAYFFYHNPGM
jgi:hypothetical protein